MVDSAYAAWSDRLEKHWEAYVSRTGSIAEALDSIRAWADRNPMTVSTTFDNEAGPDFSRIFEEAPVIEDTSRLKDYAMRLRDLMARKDTTALYDEVRLKFTDHETGKKRSRSRIMSLIGSN